MSNTGSGIVTGGSDASHINGPLNKNIGAGGSFSFPVGVNGKYNPVALSNAEADVWQAQYYQGDYNSSNFDVPIADVSSVEYWRVYSTSDSKQARVTLPYASSGITLKWALVEYSNVDSEWKNDNGSTVNTSNQTVSSNSSHSFNINPGTGNYFTIAESNLTYWIGVTSEDWFTNSNWSNGTVPTVDDNVRIPDVAPDFFPVFTGSDGECKNITIDASASLTINANNLDVSGNFTNNGTFTQNGGAVTFTGGLEQTISGSSAITFNDIIIDKSADSIILAAPVSVSGDLDLTDGIITTDDVNLLSINDGATVSNGSIDSYVDGPMQKSILSGQSFTFPVGNGNRYGYMTLSNTSAGSSPANWKVQYFNADPAGSYSGSLVSPISSISDNEYWVVERPASGTPSANITLHWDPVSYPGITDNPVLRDNLRVVEYAAASGGSWTERGLTVNAADSSVATSSVVSADNFIFTLGYAASTAEITDFSAISICDNGDVASIPVALTGTAPWSLSYRAQVGVDVYNFTQTGILSSPYTIELTGDDVGNPSIQQTFTVSLTDVEDASAISGTCDPGTVDLTVNPAPVISNFTGDNPVCALEVDINTYSIDDNGDTYVWSLNPVGTGTINSQGSASTTIDFNQVTGGTSRNIYVKITADDGTCALSDSIEVTVYRKPETGPQYHINNSFGN